jgi:hypothetical protein
MPLHRVEYVLFGVTDFQTQLGVERVELEKVTVRAAGGTGATEAHLTEIVRALRAADARLPFARHGFG